MIGDRLETDSLGARNAGLKTALVLTGIATREQVANSDIKPDGIFAGLPELMVAWD
jgi:4-nitrophenyl phosphatase